MQRGDVRGAFRALWMVRSRVLRGDLNFWLVVIGYDPRTNSINNKIYLVYAIVFFAIWIFMVLTLLADFAAGFLHSLPLATPQAAAVGVGSLTALILFLYELYQSTRRSPLVFSDADAHLLCQAPIDRRPVAFTWLMQAWVERGLGVGAGAVVLGYALLQALSPRALTPADLPAYLGAGLRMFTVAMPLYLALLALAWAVGVWRLRGRREQTNLRWLAPAIALVLVGSLAAFGLETGARLLPTNGLIRAGLGLAAWAPGFGLAVGLAAAGLAALWWAADGISLARAAQETRDKEAIQAARLTWRFDLLDELVQRERLQAARPPSRLPARPGAWAMIWKNAVQGTRRFTIADLLPWLAMMGLVVIMLAYQAWGTRGWAILVWALLTAGRVAAPLRRNLARWWIMRQLPFTSERLLAGTIAAPVVETWLAGLAGLAAALFLGLSVPWLGVWLYLALTPTIGLAAVIDTLRQCKTNELLVAKVADITLWALVFALALVAIDGGLAWFLIARLGFSSAAAFPMVIAGSLGVLYAMWQAAGAQLREIK